MGTRTDVGRALRIVESPYATRAVPARFRVDVESFPPGLDAILGGRGAGWARRRTC